MSDGKPKYDKQAHTRLKLAVNAANEQMTLARIALLEYEDKHDIARVEALGR